MLQVLSTSYYRTHTRPWGPPGRDFGVPHRGRRMRQVGWTGVGRLGLPSPEGSGGPCADIAGTIPDAVAACGAEREDSAG